MQESRLESIKQKIQSLEQLKRSCAVWRLQGHTIVFTNGVYDILHRGHAQLLAEAASHGSRLIVGINSDSSVKSLGKGSNRPINAEDDRALLMAFMQVVDAVIIFDAHTPLELIRELEPDVLAKGGDYDPEQRDPSAKDYLVGSDLQRQRGKRTVSIALVEGYSSTAIIEKSRNG